MEEALASPMQGFAPSGHRVRPLSFILELACLLACLLANDLFDMGKYFLIHFVLSAKINKYPETIASEAIKKRPRDIYSKINAYLCNLKKEKVQRLVKYICSVLLVVLAMTLADKQENTAWQESMPQSHASHYICAEQPVAERAIDHLFNERIAIPIPAAGEIPCYHPHHSKPKCLHTADRLNRYSSYLMAGNVFEHHHSPIYYHVIDYYIYTLEHILI